MISGESHSMSDENERTDSVRSRRLRRRNLRRSSDNIDIIVLDSPAPTSSSVIPRRRRRLHSNEAADISIVDLTCSTTPDDYVDLTSPDIPTPPPQQPVPVTFEISDGEDELNESTESPTPTQPALSCPVCLERFSKIVKNGGQVKSTICGHIFCNLCISTAIHHSKKCPTCRKKLDSRKIHTLYLPV